MASTRNRNTPGNYQLEQNLNACNYNLATYIHGTQGQGYTRHLPGDGLIVAQMHSRDLAENYMDIESQLFGIGSTNLENPLPPYCENPATFSVNRLSFLNTLMSPPCP